MKDNWSWLEEVFRKIPQPYPIVSYFVFIVLYLIYWIFSTKVYWFEWNIYHNFQSLATSFVVAYLLAGTQFLLNRTRDIFRYIDLLYGDQGDIFHAKLKERFTGARWYYRLLLLSVIVPFIILSWNALPYHDNEPKNPWALGLDIYGYLLLFIILLLLAEILWLSINIVWSLNEIGCLNQDLGANIDVFNIRMKLRPVRNFLLLFLIYYFLTLTFSMSTYIGPSHRFPYEVIFFAMLLFMGVVLFFVGMEAIQRIINRRVESELNILNIKREEQHTILIDIISQGGNNGKKDELDNISSILDIIEKEMDSLREINRRAYDITAISVFIPSFLIPFLTLLNEVNSTLDLK